MSFTTDPMFPGDLLDAATRFATDFSADAAASQAIQAETTMAGRGPLQAWRQAVAMGWPALLVGESSGGAGGTLADLAAVVEACARQALHLPLARRCAQAPALLMASPGDGPRGVLRDLAVGKVDLDVVQGLGITVAPLDGGRVRVAGTLEGLDAGLPCTHVLVASDAALVLVPHAALPAPLASYVGIDGSAVSDMRLDGLVLGSEAVLLQGADARQAVAHANDLAALVTAIEMAATLGATVEQCIQHLNTRVQFGVALSSFQVLRHKVVDLYVHYESASVLLARLVQDVVAMGRVAPRDAALAKLYLNDLARKGAEASIQLHGGMGMTAELPAARLARRLLCAEFEHGDRVAQLTRLQPMAG